MHRGSPRAQAMTTVTIMPAASHGAAPANVTTLPSTTDSSSPPDPVIALTRTTAPRNSSGGLTTTVSRLGGEAYNAARTQPATNASPASTPQPSQVAASRPIRKHPAIASTAPRSVSVSRAVLPGGISGAFPGGGSVGRRPGRAAGPAARAGARLGSGAIGVCREKFGRRAGQVHAGGVRGRSPVRGCRFQGGRFRGRRSRGGRGNYRGGQFGRG